MLACKLKFAIPVFAVMAFRKDRQRMKSISLRLQIILLGLASFAVYISSLPNGFAFDDVYIIERNPLIRSLANIPQLISTDYVVAFEELHHGFGLYRPLATLSFAINYAIHGLNPFGYHLTNVLLHILNTLLILRLGLLLFDTVGLMPFWVALLFALHPIHTEAVANGVGRAELLYTGLYLTAWIVHVRLFRYPPAKELLSICAILLLLTLAMLAKELAVTFIAAAVMSDLYLTQGTAYRETLTRQWKKYLLYAYATLAFLVFRFTIVPLSAETPELINPLLMLDQPFRVLNAIHILVFKYFWLLLYPLKLSPDYSFNALPLFNNLWSAPAMLTYVAVVVGAALLTVGWRYNRTLCFGLWIFIITISPVANIVKAMSTIFGERLLYLPSLGFCILLGYWFTEGLARPRWKSLTVLMIALTLLFYTVRTYTRNFDWHDNERLFTKALTVVPNSSRIHYFVGNIYAGKGDYPQAIESYNRALQIYPTSHEAFLAMGEALYRQGQYGLAVYVLQQLLAGEPGEADKARFYLAQSFLAMNNLTEARLHFEFLISHKKYFIENFTGLGQTYWREQNYKKAAEVWQDGLTYNPASPELLELTKMAADSLAVRLSVP